MNRIIKKIMLMLICYSVTIILGGCQVYYYYFPPNNLDISTNDLYLDMRGYEYELLQPIALKPMRKKYVDFREPDVRTLKIMWGPFYPNGGLVIDPINEAALFHGYYDAWLIDKADKRSIIIPAGEKLQLVEILLYFADGYNITYMATEVNGERVLVNTNALTLTNGNPKVRVEFNPAILKKLPLPEGVDYSDFDYLYNTNQWIIE